MRRGLGKALLLAVSIALGSWVGLGRPSAEQARALPAEVGARAAAIREKPPTLDDVKAALGLPAAPPASTPAPSTAGAPSELPPSPLEKDPSLLPDRGASWRALNPEASVQRAWMVAEGPRHRDNRRLVTLTFDDGPGKHTTPAVLRLLAKHHVRGTFFVIGSYLEGETVRARTARANLRRIASAGHLVGNHTYDHALLTSVSHTQVLEEIDRSAAAIERTLGTRPTLFRPPYGGLDAFGEAAVRERGLELVLWSVEKEDMKRDDEAALLRDLIAQIDYKEGGIVLLHDVRWSSVHVLEKLLGWLELRKYDPARPERIGYEIVDLPTYLRAVAADPLPYESRDELERARAQKKKSRTTRRAEDEPGDG